MRIRSLHDERIVKRRVPDLNVLHADHASEEPAHLRLSRELQPQSDRWIRDVESGEALLIVTTTALERVDRDHLVGDKSVESGK